MVTARLLLLLALCAVAALAGCARAEAEAEAEAVAVARGGEELMPFAAAATAARAVHKAVKRLTKRTKLGVVKGHDEVTEGLLHKYGTMLMAAIGLSYHPDRYNQETQLMEHCPGVPLVNYFHMQAAQKKTDLLGGNFQVITSRKLGVAVLAFRGSDEVKDWLLNAQYHPTPHVLPPAWNAAEGAKGPSCGAVHKGYHKQWSRMQAAVDARMASWATQARQGTLPYKHIFVSGHSLGGGLATIAAPHVATRFPDLAKFLTLVTFGAPNVGTKAFVSCVNARIKHSARLENTHDPIPHVPVELESVGRTKVVMSCKSVIPFKCHLIAEYGPNVAKLFGGPESVCSHADKAAERRDGRSLPKSLELGVFTKGKKKQ